MRKVSLFLVTALVLSLTLFTGVVRADRVQELSEKVNEYVAKLGEIQKQKDSLSKEISLLDYQIKITSLKISQTETQAEILEDEIENLSLKIERLDGSLDFLSKVLLSRVAESYKRGKKDSLSLFLSSRSFSDFIFHVRYLQSVQLNDQKMLLSMEQTRTSYNEQKRLKERKQTELENLKTKLEVQKKQLSIHQTDRRKLLLETQGKEAVYQNLLAEARAELEAILGILEGKGTETAVKKVAEDERIASIITGRSCNSSGTHLHFMVLQDGQVKNPFGFLKKGVDFENCSGSACGSGDGDFFSPSGGWNWPVDPRIKLTQGFGYTWAIQHIPWLRNIYDFHNGIDLQGSSLVVKAVRPGTLYAGSYNGSCTLRYVRVRHDDGGFDTYFLHVNY